MVTSGASAGCRATGWRCGKRGAGTRVFCAGLPRRWNPPILPEMHEPARRGRPARPRQRPDAARRPAAHRPTTSRSRVPVAAASAAGAPPPRRSRRATTSWIAGAARDLLRAAALARSGADAVPDRRDPRLPRHADRRRVERRGVHARDRRRRSSIVAVRAVAIARALPRADPARADRGGARRASACRISSRRPRARRALAGADSSASRSRSTSRSVKALIAENMERRATCRLRLLSGVKTGGLLVLAVLVNLALIPVVMFYLLRDWNMIVRARRRPGAARLAAQDARRSRARSTRVLAEFLRGQLLGDAGARGLLRDRAVAGRARPRARDRHPHRPAGVHPVRGLRPRPDARHDRGAAAVDRLAGLPRGARRVRRRPAARELRARCPGSSATASACIRWR